MLREALNWTFRSRETGRIVVGQRPNAPLIAFFVGAGAAWLIGVDGTAGHALLIASRIALGWWVVDEMLRGVNPWRRMLGGAVLVYLAWVVLRSGSGM